MKTYFGMDLSDSMFNGECTITRRVLFLEEVEGRIAQGVVSYCNRQQEALRDALNDCFRVLIPIPEEPPKVSLDRGDSVIIMSARGLPMLAADCLRYTKREANLAVFTFIEYRVN